MSGRISRLRENLKQRRHHRAFRIAPLPWDEPSREELERLLASVAEAAAVAESSASAEGVGAGAGAGPGADGVAGSVSADEPTGSDGSGESADPVGVPLDAKALADAATNLWRAQRRLNRQGEAATSRSRQTSRYLRSCREALDEAGLLVQEHEGDAFHTGLSLEALTFQDDPSLTAETVLETIRPTIYLNGRRIQMGQVIVGCPPAPSLAPSPEPVDAVPVPEDSVPEPEPAAASAPASASAPAPASVSEAPSSSDHERTDHA
ncbi:hypothetical protein GCM10011583_63200 [Streptomyces camponoticapitis]|uniref:Nucleotide exchange factor GrpE n=1 Tax=Streptomyces camponoticapitis TaxID=1616125 RepID=A0ABQ2ERS2_9ACTN|nr:hypothetical protein [Streptomyces camponoticapitis]GGK22617.1 hypothetical protein GCM10011583_63200 [Streptomyces camponoticapitis]